MKPQQPSTVGSHQISALSHVLQKIADQFYDTDGSRSNKTVLKFCLKFILIEEVTAAHK